MDKAVKCWNHSMNGLFPKNVKNKNIVYFINTIHIIGVLFIQYGIFLPPKYLKYHILYLIIIFSSYIVLKNQCFMTLLSNYFSDSYITFLCIKMNDAKLILILSLFASIIFSIEPSISPFNLLKKLFN